MSAIKLVLDHTEPDISVGGATEVFGVPLTKVCHSGASIPEIVEQCINYIEGKGITYGLLKMLSHI